MPGFSRKETNALVTIAILAKRHGYETVFGSIFVDNGRRVSLRLNGEAVPDMTNVWILEAREFLASIDRKARTS